MKRKGYGRAEWMSRVKGEARRGVVKRKGGGGAM